MCGGKISSVIKTFILPAIKFYFCIQNFLHSLFSFQDPPTLKLRLHKPKSHKKVQWTETTVDNEHMDKKKSKCCCVYVKPRTFGESSSESEDECEHCSGHVEMKKMHHHKPSDHARHDDHDDHPQSNDDSDKPGSSAAS